MARHRNVRNRAYSYDDDYYDDDYYEEEETEGAESEFMYRRNSPTKQHSIFSYLDQPKSTLDDQELLDQGIQQVHQVFGENAFDLSKISQQLRECNYDTNETIAILSTRPSNDKVAASLASIEKGPKVTATLGGPKVEKKTAKAAAIVVEQEETMEESRTRSLELTPAEREAFEKAEKKTQAMCDDQDDEKQRINMVVIGHVDAGKSTLMGHLLYRLGYVSQRVMHKYEKESREAGKSSFAFAWVMDADEEERNRGVTMDVGMSYFATPTKHVTLLDAPGHRDFIPKMIAGAAQADVAVLVVPASTGEFEAAFENSGQTKEHTLLVRSLGVTQMIVAVNKMDSIEWDQDRFNYIRDSLTKFLQQSGFRTSKISFVPVSGLSGENLFQKVVENTWYTGPTLLEAIDQFTPPTRPINKPFRFGISDVFKSMSLGNAVAGRVYSGAVAVGDKVSLMPLGERLTIKNIEQNGSSIRIAKAGDSVDFGVTGIDPVMLTCGSILCSIASPVQLVSKFQAQLMTMDAVVVPIVKGTCLTFHLLNIDQPVNVTKLLTVLDRSGEVIKKKPRCLTRNMNAVVEITSQRSMCLELFSEYRQFGRFTLRDKGITLAAGIITEIK